MLKLIKKIVLIISISVVTYGDDFINQSIQESIDSQIVSKACEGCEIVEISLNGLINEVVKRNYNLYTEKVKVNIAKHKVAVEEGIFEPKLQVGASFRRTNVPNSAEETVSRGFQNNYRDRVKSIETSVSGLLITGGEWKLGFTDRTKGSNLIRETQDYDTEYSDGLTLSFKQPLLRGMGTDVTYAKINMAKLGTQINATEYKSKLMDLMASTIRLYWRLYGTQKLYENWTNTLIITEQQLKNIEILAQYGKIPETEILEVKSSIFQKRTELYSLKATINEIKNQLLSLLNISNAGFNSTFFVVKDRPHIGQNREEFSLEDSYQKAINNLPELKLAELKLASGKVEHKYHENQLLPDLTLNTSISSLGLESTRNNALYCATGCNGQYSWNVGLNLEIPLYGNRQAKENLAISRINLTNSKLAIDSFQKDIYNLITTKIEQLKIEQYKLSEYRQEVKMKAQLLDIERQKLELGRSRMKDVLEYEDKLMYAQRKLFSSIVNWKVAEALLNKATGELLAKQNIELSFDEDYQKNTTALNATLLTK